MRGAREGSSFIVAIAAALVVALAPALAHAAPTDAAAQAELLFDQGKKLLESGNVAAACPKFSESARLDPGVGVALFLGDCYQRDGKTASAWAAFRDAEQLATKQGDKGRERIAHERATLLESKLVKLVIAAKDAVAGLVVKRDGLVIGVPSLGVEVPVDPGSHTVEASAPGLQTWSTTTVVAAGTKVTRVEIPVLAPLPSVVAHDDTKDKPVTLPPEEEADPGQTRRTIGLTVGAVGVVGLVTSIVVGLSARSAYDESNADGHCSADNACDATGLSRRDDAFSRGTIATVVGGIGAAALVAGAVLYFTAPSRSSSVRASFAPTGLRLEGSF
jgi:hypothetical protein